MNSEARTYLQRHIQVKLERYPDASVKEVKDWLLSGLNNFDIRLVNYDTLFSFVKRNMIKFNNIGSMDI